MNRKLKNTFVLIALLLVIVLGGGFYLFVVQKNKIEEREAKLAELSSNRYDIDELNFRYAQLLDRAAVLDSVLAARKFNIPANISSIKFYDFITEASMNFTPSTRLDVEYITIGQDRDFYYYEYKISGGGTYLDLFRLLYAVEHSKELKKVTTLALNNLVTTDKKDMPLFHVSFSMTVFVYYTDTDRFITSSMVENDLTAPIKYDPFYPLIRNEIPPNVDQLLDVQGSKLLALIPEGAFFADSRGNTYLLWEGEQVYLGYLTNIDYKNNKVSFILNKGGIIEKAELHLEKSQAKILNK
jgi:hypothetical protein